MQELMDTVNSFCGNISGDAARLSGYARAFSTTGNDTISQVLYDIATDLENSQDAIRQAISKELDRQYKQSVQSTANVFNAALAGIKVARGLPDKDLSKAAIGLYKATR
jgi:ribosomal protein L18